MIRLESEFGGPGLRLSKHLVVVPLQERGVGSVPWVSGVAQPSAIHLVVDAAVSSWSRSAWLTANEQSGPTLT